MRTKKVLEKEKSFSDAVYTISLDVEESFSLSVRRSM